ncbi:small multi-drug export protein [Bacillus paralicheniformis]|uniref:small multi-drug export protein n=1 Tax=Bacillus TaxID=1386 RepID=UPI001FB8D564|nr:small multi-drug export protein [Bacillus sp. B19-2]MCJ2148241.1 small multi-drug export protein [Bacillus sp. B19-2]
MVQEIFQRVEEVNVIYQFVAVFIIGFVPFLEAFVAVPIGILLGLPFILVVLVGAIANWLSVMAVIVFSSFMRTSFSKKEKNNTDHYINRRFQKAKSYFNKYGVPGISLLGPIIGTNHIGALVCIIAKANKKRIILWQTVSIVMWAVGTGVLLIFGVDIYNNIKK